MKRMTHPLHGFTHAHNTNEVAYLVARGWSVEEETQPEGKDDEEALRAAYFEKFGKKPHHMAKLETIKKALDDNS